MAEGSTDNDVQFQQNSTAIMDLLSGNSTVFAVKDAVTSQIAINVNTDDSVSLSNGVIPNGQSATQPSCGAGNVGMLWNLHTGAGPDLFQVCQDTTGGGSYAWVTH